MNNSKVDKKINLAEAHRRKHEFESARALYIEILHRFPGNKRAALGLEKLERTQRSLPHNSDHFNQSINALGVLHSAGRHAELAIEAERLIQRYPASFELWAILAEARNFLGQVVEAEKCFRKSIELNPQYAEARSNLGVVLQAMGRLDEAITAHRSALEVNPNFHIAHFNLGNVYKAAGRLEDAVKSYGAAVSTAPFFAQAYNNLGIVLVDLYRLAEAVAVYQRAMALEPENASTYNNLGLAFAARGVFHDAIKSYQKALSIKPDYVDAQFNIGIAFALAKNASAAIDAFRAVLRLEPSHAGALAYLSYELAKQCEWRAEKLPAGRIRELGIKTVAITPFLMLPLEDNPENQLVRSRRWAKEKLNGRILPRDISIGARKKRLRVGIFSGDFREHPVMYCISGLLRSYDRSNIELIAFNLHRDASSNLDASSKWTSFVEGAVETLFDVSVMSNAEIITLARSNELDIAIDLSGYTGDGRTIIFLEKVAPVQINFLGYPGTMGADSYDYIIGDSVVIPEEYRMHYAENVIFLPHSYFPIDNSICPVLTKTSRSDHGLLDDQLVLCCFNNSYKLGQKEFSIWMRVLSRVDNAVLWLSGGNDAVERNLKAAASAFGIDPMRLVFAPRIADKSVHLERTAHADLFLDTFNYNAHTTACDSLWSGVPIVTKAGRQFSARVAASILCAAGLPEFVTSNEKDYENLIIELAMNPPILKRFKGKLSESRESCPLFDFERYTRSFEKGIFRAYQDIAGGQRRDIVVDE